MSLKLKIYTISLIPLLFLFIFEAISISEMWKTYANAQLTNINMELSNIISLTIHEIQKERGATAGYLNNSITLKELEKQRQATDPYFNELKNKYRTFDVPNEYKEEILNAIEIFEKIRIKILKKEVAASDATREFINIISKLIQYHGVVAEQSIFGEIASSNYTLLELESTKELAGQFRARAMSILSKDEPISSNDLNVIQDLVIGMKVKLTSKTLNLTIQSQNLRKEFLESDSWKQSQETYKRIKENQNVGKFNISPPFFFENITNAINLLDMVIKAQLQETKKTVKNRFEEMKKKIIYNIIVFFSIAFTVTLSVLKISRNITSKLQQINYDMTCGIKEITTLANIITKSSLTLASSSNQQSSSIQESSASMNEIEAMIKRNSDDAKGATLIANNSLEKINTAVDNIVEMTRALQKISQSNTTLSHQIVETNSKFYDISNIIKQIGEKTSIINDIVFQTKLLSFNASVEAARAGEHGKGFAVVAEEVGNLAQMSGNASREIYQMLESSILAVDTVTHEQKDKMDQLLVSNNTTIQIGVDLGVKLEKYLKELLPQISNLKNNIDQISLASTEQLKGVNEIGIAIEQANNSARETSEISNESSDVVQKLDKNLNNFSSIVSDLKNLISGK